MTPSYFQAISGDNGDSWTRTRKGKRSWIPDPGSWILAGRGGAAGSGVELLPPEGIPNLWNYSLCLETWWKNWAWGVEGGNRWNLGDLEWTCPHGSMLCSAFPEPSLASAPDPIPTFHKNQHLFQIPFPGGLKIPGFSSSGKPHCIQAQGNGRMLGWDREYGKPRKPWNLGGLPSLPTPVSSQSPTGPLLWMVKFPRLPIRGII